MIDAVSFLDLWFPLGLTQWDRQLQATYVNLLKEALRPTCPDGSNDSIAQRQELNEMTPNYSHSLTTPGASGNAGCDRISYYGKTFGKYGVADQSLLPLGQAQWRASQRDALDVAGQL